MSKYIVVGGKKIVGEARVHGAKNAVLPILAATVLNGNINVLYDIPRLSDVEIMTKILQAVGCRVYREGEALVVDSSDLNSHEVPEDLVREMRSSFIFLGALLARHGSVKISYPGGCEIGHRPIDLHLKALREMGAEIEEKHGFLYCKAKKLKGCDIHLDFPSVGATENVILAAVFAEGTTIIRNAAREPEIVDLENYINSMGGKVSGAGSANIYIEGVDELHGVEHRIIPDRIVAGTYLIAAAITKGEILLNNVIPEHMQSVLHKLRETGCKIDCGNNQIKLVAADRIKSIDTIQTLPYPGFPTDMQSQMMSLMTISNGVTVFIENIFENRYKHTEELTRMGANIKVDGRIALIRGVKRLSGATVTSKDLRGGAALILAALAAEGTTAIESAKHVDRGYDHLHEVLHALGADIRKL